MSEKILRTKLFKPTVRPLLVPRPRLIDKLNVGLDGKLTLVFAPPFAMLLVFWLILINLALGIAFLLAAFLGTPGCEMRSYNHLIAKLQGRDPTEHFCPGGVDFADRWGEKR